MKENKEVFEDPKEISAVLNKKFQEVFTTKSELEIPHTMWKTMRCGKSTLIEKR